MSRGLGKWERAVLDVLLHDQKGTASNGEPWIVEAADGMAAWFVVDRVVGGAEHFTRSRESAIHRALTSLEEKRLVFQWTTWHVHRASTAGWGWRPVWFHHEHHFRKLAELPMPGPPRSLEEDIAEIKALLRFPPRCEE